MYSIGMTYEQQKQTTSNGRHIWVINHIAYTHKDRYSVRIFLTFANWKPLLDYHNNNVHVKSTDERRGDGNDKYTPRWRWDPRRGPKNIKKGTNGTWENVSSQKIERYPLSAYWRMVRSHVTLFNFNSEIIYIIIIITDTINIVIPN